MRKKIYWDWEKLDTETWRAQVVGGWVVKSVALGRKCQSMVFLQDYDHEWTIMPRKSEIELKTDPNIEPFVL